MGPAFGSPALSRAALTTVRAAITLTAMTRTAELLGNPMTDGLTLSGGEPLAQAADCLRLAKIAHSHGLNVWSYTGWTFEHLRDVGTAEQKALLEELDVLIDGPFLLEQRTLALPWRGSRNQRVIDVPASLAAGEAVVIPD